ncbi:hypothetical protein K438DRAFT_1750435 [Mycena galopus ATCC 62051]|nr:hypothetical protein K438DRAFT_1750435 [Mycena galopus ATCC 62051]
MTSPFGTSRNASYLIRYPALIKSVTIRMPRPITLVLTTLPAAILGIGYYYHRRLGAAYPTLRVPPALEISLRHDWPAFGMTGGNSDSRKMESWRQTHAGDMFVATVPRRLLEHNISEDTPLVVFARAFWGSWPLMVERRIVHILARFGVLFQLRGGDAGAEGERSFLETARILESLRKSRMSRMRLFGVAQSRVRKPKLRDRGDNVTHQDPRKTFLNPGNFAQCPKAVCGLCGFCASSLLGGLFVVEAHEAPLGPLVTSWWLRPSEGFPKPGRVGMLGGYHSFVVEDMPQIGNEPEPTVRLCFVSHLILSAPPRTPTPDVASESIPTRDLRGLSLRQTLIMHFHILYSRILLDLAMRRLQGIE